MKKPKYGQIICFSQDYTKPLSWRPYYAWPTGRQGWEILRGEVRAQLVYLGLSCGRQNDAPSSRCSPTNPWNLQMYTLHRRTLQIWVSILRWDYSGLSGWIQCNHKGPYKWKREAVEAEAEIGRCLAAGFEDGEGLPSRGWRWPLGAGKRTQIPPQSFQEAHRPTYTLISAQGNPLRLPASKSVRINLCHFKPLNLWWFVTAVIES